MIARGLAQLHLGVGRHRRLDGVALQQLGADMLLRRRHPRRFRRSPAASLWRAPRSRPVRRPRARSTAHAPPMQSRSPRERPPPCQRPGSPVPGRGSAIPARQRVRPKQIRPRSCNSPGTQASTTRRLGPVSQPRVSATRRERMMLLAKCSWATETSERSQPSPISLRHGRTISLSTPSRDWRANARSRQILDTPRVEVERCLGQRPPLAFGDVCTPLQGRAGRRARPPPPEQPPRPRGRGVISSCITRTRCSSASE